MRLILLFILFLSASAFGLTTDKPTSKFVMHTNDGVWVTETYGKPIIDGNRHFYMTSVKRYYTHFEWFVHISLRWLEPYNLNDIAMLSKFWNPVSAPSVAEKWIAEE